MIFEDLSLNAAYQADELRKTESERMDDVHFQIMHIAGADRSFDYATDTYGNSFSNFSEWPKDHSMNEQEQAEYFMFLFLRSAIGTSLGRILEPEENNAILFLLRHGMFLEACGHAGRIMTALMKGGNDADKGTSESDAGAVRK